MYACTLVFIGILALGLHATFAAVPKHPMQESRIQYPEPLNKEQDEVPDRCKGLTYCTIKPKNYPDEKFKKMYKDHNNTRTKREGVDGGNRWIQMLKCEESSKKDKPVHQPTMIVDLNNRQGDPSDNDDCGSEVTYEPLYQVKESLDKPWRYVVQVPEKDIIQRVRLERCTKMNEPCFKIFTPLDEYMTYCKQKITKWEVLVAKGNNETETITVELPVCCSCQYKEKPV